MAVQSGMTLPVCHCAFRQCGWVSHRLPCMHRHPDAKLWVGMEGDWVLEKECVQAVSGMYGCCGDAACLRQHIVDAHGELLIRVCGADVACKRSYCYYLEAIAQREQQKMPSVGPSVDRRAFQHVKADFSEDAVQSLICMLRAYLYELQ